MGGGKGGCGEVTEGAMEDGGEVRGLLGQRVPVPQLHCSGCCLVLLKLLVGQQCRRRCDCQVARETEVARISKQVEDAGRGGNYHFIILLFLAKEFGWILLHGVPVGLFGHVFQPSEKVSNGRATNPVYGKR